MNENETMAGGDAAAAQKAVPQEAARTRWPIGMAVVLAAAVFVLLMLPLPRLGRLSQAFSNVLHAPAFALLAIAAWVALRRGAGFSSGAAAIVAWLLAVAFGGGAELAQDWVDRDPGWNDAIANALGASTGLLWALASTSPRRVVRATLRLLGLLLLVVASWSPLCVLCDSGLQRLEAPQLASFEHPLELLRWSPNKATVQRVREHATDGDWSLRVEMTTAKYPGVTMRWPLTDWSGHQELVCDVSLDEGPSLNLIVKIYDLRHNGEKEDRFHQYARLLPGPTQIRIALADVQRAPRGRRLDLQQIAVLQFYASRPKTTYTFYLDNVRLE